MQGTIDELKHLYLLYELNVPSGTYIKKYFSFINNAFYIYLFHLNNRLDGVW